MPLYELNGQRPTLRPTAWVAPSADLIADVVLGEDASVWFSAVAVLAADHGRIAELAKQVTLS